MAIDAHLSNVTPTTKAVNVKFPNRQIIKSTMESDLDLPMLHGIALQSYISPNINHSLVSNISLCDARCTVTF